jgi:hypothetical protein
MRSNMRAAVFMIALVPVIIMAGCSDWLEADPVVIDAEYGLTSCREAGGTAHETPCIGYRPHGNLWIDSAALVFRRDRTARWTFGKTGVYNGCYLYFKECYGYDTSYVVTEGTYDVSGDTVFLIEPILGVRIPLTATIPSTWTSGESGPDIIRWTGPGAASDFMMTTADSWTFTRK